MSNSEFIVSFLLKDILILGYNFINSFSKYNSNLERLYPFVLCVLLYVTAHDFVQKLLFPFIFDGILLNILLQFLHSTCILISFCLLSHFLLQNLK